MPFPAPRRLPAMRALGRLQLLGYRAAGGFDSRPALVEEPFTAELDGWQRRAIIDRVDPPPTQEGGGRAPQHWNRESAPRVGPWRIIDYKTGDPIPPNRPPRDASLSLQRS